MIRPPVAGAVPVKVEEASITDIPDARVVWIKDLLAVVAEKEWNAIKAARGLRVTWSESKPNFPGHDGLHAHIRKAPIVKTGVQRENGSVEEGFKQAVRIIEGEYEFPTQSHASMGPACAVADVRNGQATIWTSTQKPYDSATCVAELLELPQLVDQHGMTQVQVGRRGVQPQLDAELAAARKLFDKFLFDDQLVATAPDDLNGVRGG
jgi:CO/xanthine dehydrogenase Mo-binding subunit